MTMTIDWNLFNDRVPDNALVRYNEACRNLLKNPKWEEAMGVLLEKYPSRYWDAIHDIGLSEIIGDPIENIRYERFDGFICSSDKPTDLEYLIDNRWLTFDEVMALP